MKIKTLLALSVLLSFAVGLSPDAQAKKWTITAREASLERKVDKAFKDNQLTLKETDNLKDKLKYVKDQEQKMKDKNGGKLSYENMTSLENDLNKVSEKLQKKMLEKRVQ